jgi:L-aspartate oxidase
MGGVLTDAQGRSTLDGLWACGETASTGVHGANRLASNSLLEAVVFGARVARDIGERLPQHRITQAVRRNDADAPLADPADRTLLRRTMSDHVGVVRDRASLEKALGVIAALEARNRSPRFRNALTAARIIATAALLRLESRGGHYRADYPQTDPAWRHRTFVTLAEILRAGAPARAAELSS